MAKHEKTHLTGKVSGETDPDKIKTELDRAAADNEAARDRILRDNAQRNQQS